MEICKIIPFLEENQEKIKINCATGNSDMGIDKMKPLFEFSKNKFKEWQENQNNEKFNRDYILSIIYMAPNEWLFAGIYQCIDVEEITTNNQIKKYLYKTELLEYGKEFIGKLVVGFEYNSRERYLNMENHINNLLIYEIKKQEYKFDPFPGYMNVSIQFDLLKEIVNNHENSWETALSNVKGIYLISDKLSGKLYVGAAYGEYAFWQRWSKYVNTGHGDNKLLKKIVENNGIEYCSNFIFSILEICNVDTRDEEIMERESVWKNRLLSKEFGYNDN